MQLHSTGDADVYARAAIDFLDADRCRRNVLRTVLETARNGTSPWTGPPTFWWAVDDGRVVAAASWTPPFHLLVSGLTTEVAVALAASAVERSRSAGVRIEGVRGPEDSARALATAWSALTGESIEVQMAELLHHLGDLEEPPVPPGAWRRAVASDRAVITRWLVDFAAEARTVAAPNPGALADTLISDQRCSVWEEGGAPVSMAARAVRVGAVARIGPVYTPPEHRQHGYARRLTYEVTRQALETGATDAVLYTDAANPISNSIYAQVGFRPVERHLQLGFVASAAHHRKGVSCPTA